jgi:hypothetical protein
LKTDSPGESDKATPAGSTRLILGVEPIAETETNSEIEGSPSGRDIEMDDMKGKEQGGVFSGARRRSDVSMLNPMHVMDLKTTRGGIDKVDFRKMVRMRAEKAKIEKKYILGNNKKGRCFIRMGLTFLFYDGID